MDKRVLVVDDDRMIREMTRDALSAEGFRVSLAASGAEALEALAGEGPFELVITDLSMRGMDGLELLEHVKREHAATDVIILTGYASLESALQAMRLGATDYLQKPVSGPEVAYAAKRAMLRRRLMAENATLRGSVQAFEASKLIATCLEESDVMPLALDIMLRLTDRKRAVARLHHGDGRPADGTYLVGFEAEDSRSLRREVEQGKLFQPGSLESSPEREVREDLARAGLEDEILIGLPVRVEGRVVGGFWLFSEGRDFSEDEIRRAEVLVAQTELALLNADRFLRAREKAFVDDVTELYNARYLLAALDREVSRAERSKLSLSVLFLDLDRFKSVNDSHGHLVGSQVLRELGEVLSGQIRAIDTLGRYGGDEFTMLLVDTDHEGARRVAERVRETVEAARFGQARGLSLQLSVSVGISSFPQHGTTGEELLDRADKAMYLGKARGRNRVCSADDL